MNGGSIQTADPHYLFCQFPGEWICNVGIGYKGLLLSEFDPNWH